MLSKITGISPRGQWFKVDKYLPKLTTILFIVAQLTIGILVADPVSRYTHTFSQLTRFTLEQVARTQTRQARIQHWKYKKMTSEISEIYFKILMGLYIYIYIYIHLCYKIYSSHVSKKSELVLQYPWINNEKETSLQSIYRADFRLVPSQWEMSLQSNTVSHWLDVCEKRHIDGLMQDCSISSALAMEKLQSCTKPSYIRQLINRSLNTLRPE